MLQYLFRVARSLSIVVNALLWGNSNQTFSARNFIWKSKGKPNLVWLFDLYFKVVFKEENHCLEAYIIWTSIDEAIRKVKR